MISKTEFATTATQLMAEGYLLDFRDLVYFQDGEILYAAPDPEKKTITAQDVSCTLLSSYSPETTIMEMFKQVVPMHGKSAAMMVSQNRFTHTAARAGKTVYPYLDDFAQMFGYKVEVRDTQKCLKTIVKKSACLIEDLGGLCKARSLYDLHAMAMVLEKGCQAQINSWFLGGGIKISYLESMLMRMIFVHKYSKKATNKNDN